MIFSFVCFPTCRDKRFKFITDIISLDICMMHQYYFTIDIKLNNYNLQGNFDMDDFKRFYSNNDEDKSIPYFWEKFDKENYSIWRCDYKYADELTMVFMSCNLIGG